MKVLAIGLIILGCIGVAAHGMGEEIQTIVVGVLDIETSASQDIAYDLKKALLKELQKNSRVTIVDINETCSFADLKKNSYERTEQYRKEYTLDMILHTIQDDILRTIQDDMHYDFYLIDMYTKRVNTASLDLEGIPPASVNASNFSRISRTLLTHWELNRVMRAKRKALGAGKPFALEEEEEGEVEEEEESTADLLIERGPSLLAEGGYQEVLDAIQMLPAQDKVKVEIRTLECFANLKCWVMHKDQSCKLDWGDQRKKLIALRDNEATPVLIKLLQSSDSWLRKYAAELLYYIGDARALDALREAALHDEKSAVRRYAKAAYKEISGENL